MTNGIMTNLEKTKEYWIEYVEQLKRRMPRNYSLQSIEDLIVHLLNEHPFYEWRNVKSLADEIGCSVSSLECHLDRMADKDIVVQHRSNEYLWGSTTRVGRGNGTVQPSLNSQAPEPWNPDMFDGMRNCILEANKCVQVATALVEKAVSMKLA